MTEPATIAATLYLCGIPDCGQCKPRRTEEQQQDAERHAIHDARKNVDHYLAALNRYREMKGMGPVTLLIPEERA